MALVIRRLLRAGVAIALGAFASGCSEHRAPKKVVVGSKAFPESWIVAEAARLSLERAHVEADTRRNLGGTEIAFEALRRGSIDMYPEYTGTIARVVLRKSDRPTLSDMRADLDKAGISISDPLGFADGYGLAVTARARTKCPGLQTITDLSRCPGLRFAFSHEFLGRSDGWPMVERSYRLAPGDLRGVEHELAYVAAANGSVDVIDVYTTDPQIAELKLAVLDDDHRVFPRYDAVLLYRSSLKTRSPEAERVVQSMAGSIGDAAMMKANSEVVLRHRSIESAAIELLDAAAAPNDKPKASSPVAPTSSALYAVLRDGGRHLEIVSASLLAAILFGIPLGIGAARSRWLAALSLGAAALLQTVPSLALLALLIPLLGVGPLPALVALFVYSLLPIVRNTCTALNAIPAALADSARAIGLSPRSRLLRVEIPLASPTILAGVRTSAVINVGTATLAALIGAGGLGGLIVEGLALRSTPLILRGALPVAFLAIAIDAAFAGLSRLVVPRGLRLSVARSE